MESMGMTGMKLQVIRTLIIMHTPMLTRIPMHPPVKGGC
jgi:hypothetical protein